MTRKQINDKRAKEIEQQQTKNMRIYKVYSTDDYGRPEDILGYVKADNKLDARALMAQKFNNDEIVKTGYYGAKMVSLEEYNGLYEKARKELAKFDRNLL